MKLAALASAAGLPGPLPAAWGGTEITAVVQDSRQASPGSLFVAVRGYHSDGHQFIPQALRQGAAALVVEERSVAELPEGLPVLRVPDSRVALAAIAAAFYGHPSRKLMLLGITGTNGKTTTSYLARSIIEAAGLSCGLIGTIDYRIGGRVIPAPNTTPESLDLQRLLAEMAGQGAGACVMEVSSHALALGRTAGCAFRAAAFTNLTQDHLDFHGSMEAYFAAKLRLFTGLGPGSAAVVNIDDPRSSAVIQAASAAAVLTTGSSAAADVRPLGPVVQDLKGLAFRAATPAGEVEVASPLLGRHNAANILTALGLGVALGLPAAALAEGVRRMAAVPGRMEKLDEGQPFGVIVDYAHTEDALTRLLETVGELAQGRVITVFGCGGDRDRTKRPRMGAAAAAGSDAVIVTSDNPRTEDPLAIIREIEQGMGSAERTVIPDRAEAIEAAVAMAEPGDVVVIAGKGHEDYQDLGGRKVRFDDREQARQALRRLRAGRK